VTPPLNSYLQYLMVRFRAREITADCRDLRHRGGPHV
jgi:hypothetical protein